MSDAAQLALLAIAQGAAVTLSKAIPAISLDGIEPEAAAEFLTELCLAFKAIETLHVPIDEILRKSPEVPTNAR